MPTYSHLCPCCYGERDVFCAMADRDKTYLCNECGAAMVRQVDAPAVMMVALPDGTKRFGDLRQRIALDRAKKWNLDKTETTKIERELRKIDKET